MTDYDEIERQVVLGDGLSRVATLAMIERLRRAERIEAAARIAVDRLRDFEREDVSRGDVFDAIEDLDTAMGEP